MENSHELQLVSPYGSSSRCNRDRPFLYRDYFKRFFDLLCAIILLPLVSPLLLLLMLIIKVNSKGPAIFKSQRIGRHGNKFYIYKLRTMCSNAEEKLKSILEQDPIQRQEWEKDHKLKNDPRITKLGKFLRAVSLDEIPQIFNVLKGDMAFVGPRPIVTEEIKKYGNKIDSYKSVRPGITGIWQINGRNDTSYEKRVDLDFKYARETNIKLDLFILLKTIPVALSKRGAY